VDAKPFPDNMKRLPQASYSWRCSEKISGPAGLPGEKTDGDIGCKAFSIHL
jgi:hypothetical protein